MDITFGRAAHVSLHYQILRQLDLGRDAASLWVPGQKAAIWAAGLTAIYLEADASTRLALQGLPLHTPDLDAHLTALQTHQSELFVIFADVMLVEEPAFIASWEEDRSDAIARSLRAEETIKPPLQALRRGLWARRGEEAPPPLQVLDATALGPHGRAMDLGTSRACAISLLQPFAHIVCQVFHEETHAIADPETLSQFRQEGLVRHRDTQASAEGYALHRRIEQHAIEVGAEVIAATAPGWMDAYQKWCKPFV